MSRQIVLDTETTGINPKQGHRIIEIGCIELRNRVITGDHRHWYIHPERDIDAGAQKVHGISLESLADKPKFAEIIDEFLEYIKGAELIIHNAPFDIGFLDHELQLAGPRYKNIANYSTVLDTLVLARMKHPGQRNSLDALCSRYCVDNSNRELHGALLDSELLAQVYLLMSGGQTQMFDQEEGAVEAISDRQIKRVSRNRVTLPVIEPTQAELEAHQTYLQEMPGAADAW